MKTNSRESFEDGNWMEITGIQWQVFGLDVPSTGVLLPWISKYNPLVSDSIYALVAEYTL